MGKKAKSRDNVFSGRFKHFRRQPDGSLVFAGDVDYTYPIKVMEPPCKLAFNDWILKERNADDVLRLEAEREAFENLVDRANETEA